jgi:hypothetical protein
MNSKPLKDQAKAFFVSHYVALLALLLLIPLMLVQKPDVACAGAAIAPTPCDPTYYESLENRAWLEAQREITQNQNLIFKPDSVLSYTCFEQYLGVLANQTQNMFSESNRWGNEILGANQNVSMDTALSRLVIQALVPFLELNFHGGSNRRTLGNRPGAPNRSRPENTHNTTPMPSGYNCSLMNQVWMAAKCYNFATQPNDGFFTFENYDTTADKRLYPTPCAAGPDYGAPIIAAGLNPTSPPPWPADITQTYFGMLSATADPSIATDCSDSRRIPSGVQVRRTLQSPTTFQEFVCLEAGCHYQPPSGGGSGTCVP